MDTLITYGDLKAIINKVIEVALADSTFLISWGLFSIGIGMLMTEAFYHLKGKRVRAIIVGCIKESLNGEDGYYLVFEYYRGDNLLYQEKGIYESYADLPKYATGQSVELIVMPLEGHDTAYIKNDQNLFSMGLGFTLVASIVMALFSSIQTTLEACLLATLIVSTPFLFFTVLNFVLGTWVHDRKLWNETPKAKRFSLEDVKPVEDYIDCGVK